MKIFKNVVFQKVGMCLSILIFVSIAQHIYAGVKLPKNRDLSVWLSLNSSPRAILTLRYTEWLNSGGDVAVLTKEIVPELYLEHFLRATEHALHTRRSLLAIGLWESGWRVLRSHRANADGTYDWGVLQVNENNLNNPMFMYLFGAENPTGDWRIDYMIVGVNFFIFLKDTFGRDAHTIYNSGESAWARNQLAHGSILYRRNVDRIYYSFERRLNEIRSRHFSYLALSIQESWDRYTACMTYLLKYLEYLEYSNTPEPEFSRRFKRIFAPELFYDNRQTLMIVEDHQGHIENNSDVSS